MTDLMTKKLEIVKTSVYAAWHDKHTSESQWKGLIKVLDAGGFKPDEHCDNVLVTGAITVTAHDAGIINALYAVPRKQYSPICGDPEYYNFIMFWRLSERLEHLFITKLRNFGLVQEEHLKVKAWKISRRGDSSIVYYCGEGQYIEHRFKGIEYERIT